jgi:Flp pilus assembly protein TadG
MRVQIRSKAARIGAFLRSGEGGQALVEIAITLPILLILLTGIYSFGVTYACKLALTNAVGEAAQTLQVSRSGNTDPCATAWNSLKAAAPALNSSNITMTVTFDTGATGGGTALTENSCSGQASSFTGLSGVTNEVSASYPCSLAIYGRVFASCTIQAAVSVYEY